MITTIASNRQQDRILVLVTGLGAFLTSFDSSATTSILPSITVQFHSDPQMGKWIATAYVLVICALLLPAGRLGDQWG
ncbi:MAG: MFS transporter, partial [Flavisolibacter sp.]